MKKECPLCNQNADIYHKAKQTYFRCTRCLGVFVDKNELPSMDAEKQRYELHGDDANDDGYRKFVSPIPLAIEKDFTSKDKGLDFGAGTSAIISTILKEKKYNIKDYDPFFHIYPELLKKKYDYISSCEVVEHFYTPYKEFALLKSMLEKKGKLYLMTELYNEGIDFASWYYKNDSTHVFFYSKETFEWIQKEFEFSKISINKRLVIFEN